MVSILSGLAQLKSPSVDANDFSYGSSSTLEQEVTQELDIQLKAKTQKEPVLVLIGGFQGSGKSSLIRRIKEKNKYFRSITGFLTGFAVTILLIIFALF